MTHLILTVGTGTAGKHSNLAAGLRKTLELMAPDYFWLVPSASEDSIIVAELVREGISGFQPWEGDTVPYRCIAQHDSLADCRAAVREVIAVARRAGKGARLLVNPTSGTKQMSAGATLAALDEGVGEIVFTVGERADGVVVTGTEKMETFDPSAFFAERDLATAADLYAAGAFDAAARLLARHDSLAHPRELAACWHEWDRLNYEAARKIAAASACPALIPLRGHLQALAQAARNGEPPSVLIVADILDNAAHHLRRGDTEAALVTACKAVEMGLRFALWSQTELTDPYDLDRLNKLPLPAKMQERFRSTSNDNRTTVLGLRQVAEILKHLGDPVAAAFNDGTLQVSVRIRNDLTHKVRAVTTSEATGAVSSARAFLRLLQPPEPPPRPASLHFTPAP